MTRPGSHGQHKAALPTGSSWLVAKMCSVPPCTCVLTLVKTGKASWHHRVGTDQLWGQNSPSGLLGVVVVSPVSEQGNACVVGISWYEKGSILSGDHCFYPFLRKEAECFGLRAYSDLAQVPDSG